MDQMRESGFAILGDLTGQSFLDLFSGSGVIALEAASRGASPVELVEKDHIKVETVLKNMTLAEIAPCSRIRCHFMAAELFLRRCKTRYDLIFCDPPFPYQFHTEIAQTVSNRKLLTDSGIFLIHRPRELAFPETIGTLKRVKQKEYGRSVVEFMQGNDTF
jgi:16S rRNA (guanine(966)-N(2))-methyltransferase RsmD